MGGGEEASESELEWLTDCLTEGKGKGGRCGCGGRRSESLRCATHKKLEYQVKSTLLLQQSNFLSTARPAGACPTR